MELEYSDKSRRRSKLYIAVGLILAIVVAATVFLALRASGLTAAPEVETRDVVVAVREIPDGEEGEVQVQRPGRPDERDGLRRARRGPPAWSGAGRDRAAVDPERAGLDERG